MIEKADILTIWVINPDNGGNETPLRTEFDTLGGVDVTGQSGQQIIPDPNSSVWRITAETAAMDAIAADPNYTILEGTRGPVDAPTTTSLDTVPTQADYAQFRTHVLDMANPDTGRPIWTAGQFIAAVGALVDGRTWRTINAELTEFLRTAPPKGQPGNLKIKSINLSDDGTGIDVGFEI